MVHRNGIFILLIINKGIFKENLFGIYPDTGSKPPIFRRQSMNYF